MSRASSRPRTSSSGSPRRSGRGPRLPGRRRRHRLRRRQQRRHRPARRRGRRDRGLPQAQPGQGGRHRVGGQRASASSSSATSCPSRGVLLLLDADLGRAPRNCAPADRAGRRGPGRPDHRGAARAATADGADPGGFGLVMGRPPRGITELTGWTPRAPLSGQRCLTRRAFELASPLAAGFGRRGRHDHRHPAGRADGRGDRRRPAAPGDRQRPGRAAAPRQAAARRHPGARRSRAGAGRAQGLQGLRRGQGLLKRITR